MDLFKRIQDLSAIYDDDGPSSTVLESRPMFNDGGRIPFDNGGDAFKLKKLQEDYDNFGKKELNKAAKTLGFKNYESMSGVENSNFRRKIKRELNEYGEVLNRKESDIRGRKKRIKTEQDIQIKLLEETNKKKFFDPEKFAKENKISVKQLKDEARKLRNNIYDKRMLVSGKKMRSTLEWIPDDLKQADITLNKLWKSKLIANDRGKIENLFYDAFGNPESPTFNPKKHLAIRNNLTEYYQLRDAIKAKYPNINLALDHPLSKSSLKNLFNASADQLTRVNPLEFDLNNGFKDSLSQQYELSVKNKNPNQKKAVEKIAKDLKINIGKINKDATNFNYGVKQFQKLNMKDEILKAVQTQADLSDNFKTYVKNNPELFKTANVNPNTNITKITQGQVKKIESLIASLGGGDCGRGFKNQGGRIGLKDGPVNVDVCFKNGLERVKKGGVDFTKAESSNFSKLTKGIKAMGASNIVKLGVIPEALFEGALIADKMASEGDSFMQGVRNSYLAIPFQKLGLMKTYDEGRREEILNPELINEDAAPLGEMQKKRVQDVFNLQDSLNRKNQLRQSMFNLEKQKKATDAISDGPFGYVGDTQNLDNRILKRRQELEGLYDDPRSKLGKVSMDEKLLTTKPMDLNIKDQLTMDAYNQAVEKANTLRAGNIKVTPGTGFGVDAQIKKRMKELPVTPEYAKEQLQATGDYYNIGYTPYGMNKLFTLMGRQNPQFGINKQTGKYDEEQGLNDYMNHLRTLDFADNFREEKAGGGISGLSGGDPKGAMTRSMNPDSQGLSYLFNRVKKV